MILLAEGKVLKRRLNYLLLHNCFKERHFHLRKWKTNSAQLNDLIFIMKLKKYVITDNNAPKEVLGVTWNNKTDTLIYDFLDLIKEENC